RRQRSGHQEPGAVVDAERARMGGANVGVLDGGRLAGLLVDGKHRDVTFAGAEHHLAVHILHARPGRGRKPRAVAEINKTAVGMSVERAGALDAKFVGGVRQRGLDEKRLRSEIAVRAHLVHNELTLTFDRKITPWLRRMDIEVSAAETVAAVRRDLTLMRKH